MIWSRQVSSAQDVSVHHRVGICIAPAPPPLREKIQNYAVRYRVYHAMRSIMPIAGYISDDSDVHATTFLVAAEPLTQIEVVRLNMLRVITYSTTTVRIQE